MPAAVLLRRPVGPQNPRPMSWTDLGILAWLVVGLVVAPLPRSWRWRLCAFVARFSGWTGRARSARERMLRIARIPPHDMRRTMRTLYAGRFCATLDVVRGLLLGPDMRIACRRLDEIEAALTRGRGVILWISDFVGAGDVSKLALAQAGYRIVHLSRPQHGFSSSAFGMRFLNPLRIRFERAHIAERVVFDRMNPKAAMSRLLRCLRAGGIVSITASMHEGGQLVDLPFMAGRLRIAAGALRLAWISGAAVIPVSVLRDQADASSFGVVFTEPLRMPTGLSESEAIVTAACDYRDRLEAVVRERPDSWVGWRRADQLAFASAATDVRSDRTSPACRP